MDTPTKIKPSNRTIINIKQMSLLKHSCILNNTNIYGNLFDCLKFYDRLKEKDFNSDLRFDEKARSVVQNNMKTLLEDAQREWSAVSMCEVTDHDVFCTLCGTKNTNIYYIKNSISGEEINVGVNCASEFPGFLNIKEVRKDKREEDKRQLKRKREYEFDLKINDDISFTKDASEKFESFEIMLPSKLHKKIKSIIQQMNFIRTSYIENGGDLNDALLRRLQLKKEFEATWDTALQFKYKNSNNPFICHKYIADWLLTNNKDVWEKVSNNNAILDHSAIQSIYNMQFIREHLINFKQHLTDCDMNLAGIYGNNIVYSFQNQYLPKPILIMIPCKIFMQTIGANCLTNPKYVYGKNDFDTFQLLQSQDNLNNLLEYFIPLINAVGYNIEEDYRTNQLFLVKLPRKKRLGNKWSSHYENIPVQYKAISSNLVYTVAAKIIFASKGKAELILEKYLNNITTGWMSEEKKKIYTGMAASAAAMSKQSEFIPYV